AGGERRRLRLLGRDRRAKRDTAERNEDCRGEPAHYFHPLGLRVNLAGNAGLLSGAGSGSPDARLISRSRSSSLGRPAIWSTNIRECCDWISNFLPQVLHVTSSSRRSRWSRSFANLARSPSSAPA